MTNSMLNFAQRYREVGFSPIPLKRNKRPYIDWQKYQEVRPTENEINLWWSEYPSANIGLVTGKVGGLLVLDVESSEGYEALINTITDLPETITQSTGRENGSHLLFSHPGDGIYPNWAKKIHDVDFRGDGGYIMVAPSIHPNGSIYKWDNINPLEDGIDDLMGVSEELHDFLCKLNTGNVVSLQPDAVKKNPEGWLQELLLYGIDKGSRNDTMCKVIGYYVGANPDWEKDRVLTEALCFNYEVCRPPLSRNEILATVTSICSRNESNKVTKNEKLVGSRLEQQIYPDGTSFYHLYLSDKHNDYIELSPAELLSCRAYKTKVMIKTGEIISHQSQKRWDVYVQTLLDTKTIRVHGVDEGSIGKIIDCIENELHSGRVSSDYMFIKKKACILRDGSIRVNINGIEKALMQGGIFNMHRRDLTGFLRRLGFAPMDTSYREDSRPVHVKIWVLNSDDFKVNIDSLQRGADIEKIEEENTESLLREVG